MPAVLDSAQHGTVLPAPAQQTALDRLIRLAVERSRAQIAAHGQHLHVEAMAPQVRVFGDPEALADALAQLLCAAAAANAERGALTLAVSQVGLNVTLCVRAEAPSSASVPTFDREPGDWVAVGRARDARDGTREYRLLLPVMPEGCAAEAPRVSMIGAPGQSVCRVLVVDDSADAADSIACLLAIRGHEVQVAYDGPSAYEKARNWQPEVVVLDIDLPGMKGDEIAVSLRNVAGEACPKLIALSGYDADVAAPFDLYLTKPVDPAFLLQSVERYAAGRGA